jgi:hypothetical protein
VNKTHVFCSAARRKFWNLPTNTIPTDCILFCREEEEEEEEELKLTAFRSAVQRKLLELRPKVVYFLPRSESFWNCEQKHCIYLCCAAKSFEFANTKNNSKLPVFCSTVQPKVLELRTSIVFTQPRRETFWNGEQKSTGLRSEKFGIYKQKQLKSTVFCSAAQ